jgi:GT2 family glycosyltransferase
VGSVTVVIATRNRVGPLSCTVDRLLRLPERPPIIVVDNASTDDTVHRLAADYPSVRLVALRRNEGAQARNVGVAQAATPYVAFADDDSSWTPGSLGRAAALFDGYPRMGLLAANIEIGAHRRPDPGCSAMASSPLGRPPDLPGPAVVGFVCCAAIVRRQAFLACGGFDPVVFFMGEEERLAYDLIAAGWGIAYCADVVARHWPVDQGGSAGKRRLQERNRVLTAWMRRPVPVAARLTAAHLGALLGRRHGLRSTATLLGRLPRALANRRRPDPAVEQALAVVHASN